jgi:hypothetical protein
MRGPFALVVCVLSLAACTCSRDATPGSTEPTATATTESTVTVAPAGTPPTTAPAEPIPARDTDPTPDPITHPCVVKAVNYDQAIESGSTACKTDADCGCYQGGIGDKSGCGGVLNRASVKKLDDIAKEFHDMKCKITQDCAAWACRPHCEAGACVR